MTNCLFVLKEFYQTSNIKILSMDHSALHTYFNIPHVLAINILTLSTRIVEIKHGEYIV